MSDDRKEAEEKMAKAIFISADCWLCVYDLLPPRQLGLGIALISHRFDYYVDEHFKTRKWALKYTEIWRKIGKNGAKEMQIVKFNEIPLPIPQIQVPRKVIGFKRIDINFIDQNAIAFLHHFRSLFAACPINLAIGTNSDRIWELISRNILPMLRKSLHGLRLSDDNFHRLRQFAPSFLSDSPSLRVVFYLSEDLFIEFPCDDSAMASDGQALAKWLFTARPDNVPKVYNCILTTTWKWASKIAALKAAFASASSPANFIAVISFFHLSVGHSVVPFEQTNELTREQLTLKRTDNCQRFLFVRCPIVRDESKWTKWEAEAIGPRDLLAILRVFFDQWNLIYIQTTYDEDEIEDGSLDATPGPSDQQKK